MTKTMTMMMLMVCDDDVMVESLSKRRHPVRPFLLDFMLSLSSETVHHKTLWLSWDPGKLFRSNKSSDHFISGWIGQAKFHGEIWDSSIVVALL